MSNQTFSIWDGSVASSFGGGTGTESNPYLINSAAQLAYLEEVFNSTTVKYYGKYYKLTSNIDLDKREWTPIGDLSKMPKIGMYYMLGIHFDGDNHIVRGLSIDRPEEDKQGLFGSVIQPSTFKNITIEDAYVSGKQGVGGLIGSLGSNWECGMENCHFSGEIHGYMEVGGIAGGAPTIYVRNCTNAGTITADERGGGIAGGCYGWDYCEVVNCVNTGTVTGRTLIGGITGYSNNVTLFKYCHNSGNVSTEQTCAGGITGGYGSFEYCSNSGSVTGGTSYIGGITGGNWLTTGISTSNYSQGYLKNCHNSGTITGADYVGGLLGSACNVTIELCNNTGTVNGTGGKIGGICGSRQGLGNDPIEYCTNEGAVNSSSGGRVGGIVGEGRNVKQCHNTGAVKGQSYVAGICGYCSNADFLIAGCVNDGFIEATSYAGGIAGYFYGTIQNCINMAPIRANSGAGGIVYLSNSAVKNCYNTGSITGTHSLGGIIYSTSGGGFILEKNYNSGEIGSTNNSGAIIGLLSVNGAQIIDCHYHAGSAQKGIGGHPVNISIEATGYVESVVSADDHKTVPAMLTQSIMTNAIGAMLLSWSKKKQQLLTQISKLVSISKSLGVGQDETSLDEIAGDDMYIVTEHTPVREAADPNSNIISMCFKKDMVKVMPQTRSAQGDYYRILMEDNQVGLISSASLAPANIQGSGNMPYTVMVEELPISKHPSCWSKEVGHFNYGNIVQIAPNANLKEDIAEENGVDWLKVYFNATSTGWVRKQTDAFMNLMFERCVQRMENYLQTGVLDDSVITWMAKNGSATVNSFGSGQFYNHQNDNTFDEEILAWTNFWNHRIINYSANPYPNKTLVRANVVKAIIAQESTLGTVSSKNSTRNVMGCLFAGDPTLWIASAIDPLVSGKYHYDSYGDEAITIRKLDGTIEPDGALIKSYKSNETRSYRFGTGFRMLDSVILANGGGKSGNEYLIEYSAMSPRMSIAIGTGTLAYKINIAEGGSEKNGVMSYGTGAGYDTIINKNLGELGAALLTN